MQFEPEQVSYIAWQKEQRRQQYARLDTFDATIMRDDWRKAWEMSRSLASEGRYAQASAWNSHADALKAILDAHVQMVSGAAAAKVAFASRDPGVRSSAKEHLASSNRGRAAWSSLLASLPLHEPVGVYEADYRPFQGVSPFEFQATKRASQGGVVRMPELLTRAEWKEVAFMKRVARRLKHRPAYIDDIPEPSVVE